MEYLNKSLRLKKLETSTTFMFTGQQGHMVIVVGMIFQSPGKGESADISNAWGSSSATTRIAS